MKNDDLLNYNKQIAEETTLGKLKAFEEEQKQVFTKLEQLINDYINKSISSEEAIALALQYDQEITELNEVASTLTKKVKEIDKKLVEVEAVVSERIGKEDMNQKQLDAINTALHSTNQGIKELTDRMNALIEAQTKVMAELESNMVREIHRLYWLIGASVVVSVLSVIMAIWW